MNIAQSKSMAPEYMFSTTRTCRGQHMTQFEERMKNMISHMIDNSAGKSNKEQNCRRTHNMIQVSEPMKHEYDNHCIY